SRSCTPPTSSFIRFTIMGAYVPPGDRRTGACRGEQKTLIAPERRGPSYPNQYSTTFPRETATASARAAGPIRGAGEIRRVRAAVAARTRPQPTEDWVTSPRV